MQVPSMRLFREKINELTNGKLGKSETAVRATRADNDGNGRNIANTYATYDYVDNLPPGFRLRINQPRLVLYSGYGGSPAGSNTWHAYKVYRNYTKSSSTDSTATTPLTVTTQGDSLRTEYDSDGYTWRYEYSMYPANRDNGFLKAIINECTVSGNFSGTFSATMNVVLAPQFKSYYYSEARTSSGTVTLRSDGSKLYFVSGSSFLNVPVCPSAENYFATYFTLTNVKIVN